MSPLTLHVLPKIEGVPIDQIDHRTLVGVLRPIWNTKADTARKITKRLNIIFKHATALDLNIGLQAVAKAKHLLGRSTHMPQRIAALHWKDVPNFYEDLKNDTPTVF